MIYNVVRVKKYFVPNLMSPIAKSNSRKESHYEKMKTFKQQFFAGTLILLMLFTLFALAANVNAASKRIKALKAYQKKLTRLDSRYNKFALIYLDKDSIPELLITPDFSVHAVAGEVYTYTGGKLKQLKYAGSDCGRLIYSKKKSVVSNSAWINGYGAVSTFYRFNKKGKRTKLKTFEESYLPKTLYKINGKKVSKKKFNSEYKKIVKKYPLKEIWPSDTFNLTPNNINNLVKNYKSFIITGKKH